MAQRIGSLVVDLIAETASFNANMTKAAANLNSRAAQMNSALASVERSAARLKGMGQAVIGFVAASGFATAAKQALDYAASIGEVSQQIGVTTHDLQAYRYAATQVGISQEDMEKSLAKLSVTAGQAAGGMEAQAAAFSRLGISVRDSNGHVKTAGALIPEIARRLGQVTDPAERAAAEVALFGRAGQKLDPLLNQGAQGVQSLIRDAEKLGVVLSDKLITQADEAADKLESLKFVMQAQLASVVAENAQAFVDLANAIGGAVSKLGEFFSTMRGVDRIKRDEGWAAGFFASWDKQVTAADPKKYVQMRGNELNAAKARLAELQAEKPLPNLKYIHDDLVARQQERVQRARWLWINAKNDPDYLAAMAKPVPQQPAKTGGDSLGKIGGSGTGGARAAKHAADEAKRLSDEYEKQLADLQQALKVEQLRRDGLTFQADMIESEAQIRERFKGLDDERLRKLLDQNSALQVQRTMFEQIDKVNGGGDLLLDKPLWVMPDADIQKKLDEVTGYNRQAAQKVQTNWIDATHGILYAFDDLASGIKGNFLQAVQGALDLFLQLGSLGVFGKSLSGKINASKSTVYFPGYDNGGYTGNMPVGAIAGYVHGQEYVFDAAATQRIGVDNLERIRRGAGFMRGGYVGGRAAQTLARAEWRPAVVQVVPSPYFDVTVDSRATAVAAPMSVRAAQGGAELAGRRSAQTARNSFPSRRR